MTFFIKTLMWFAIIICIIDFVYGVIMTFSPRLRETFIKRMIKENEINHFVRYHYANDAVVNLLFVILLGVILF